MKNRMYVIYVLFICIGGSGALFGQEMNRDLSEYETGQIFDRKLDFADPSAKVLEKAQSYIWTSWVNRKKVNFNIYEYNREGDRVNFTFYVEPGPNGEWQIVTSSIIDRCEDSGSMKRSCRLTPIITTYDRVNWENLRLLTMPKATQTNIKILVLLNSKTGKRYELRRGALF